MANGWDSKRASDHNDVTRENVVAFDGANTACRFVPDAVQHF